MARIDLAISAAEQRYQRLFAAWNTNWPVWRIGELVKSFASDALRQRFLPPMLDGRYSGTMALTEPGQGSALGDIRTTARPAADGSYRVFGQKMFISGGDHELTDNIVHMVLARIEGAPAGVKGISLFLVPKFLVGEDGSLGPRNDVALAGLLHKMGYRNTTSTVLSFGEKDGALGYLVGEANKGLNMVNYLRGQSVYETKLYRDRRYVLGDMVNAVPLYIAKPRYNFGDKVSMPYLDWKEGSVRLRTATRGNGSAAAIMMR